MYVWVSTRTRTHMTYGWRAQESFLFPPFVAQKNSGCQFLWQVVSPIKTFFLMSEIFIFTKENALLVSYKTYNEYPLGRSIHLQCLWHLPTTDSIERARFSELARNWGSKAPSIIGVYVHTNKIQYTFPKKWRPRNTSKLPRGCCSLGEKVRDATGRSCPQCKCG